MTTTATKTPKGKQAETLYQEQSKPSEKTAPATTASKLLDDVIERTVQELDHLAISCVQQVEEAEGRLKKSVLMARAIHALKMMLNDKVMNDYFMPLQNSKLGFLTDRANAKDGQPREYPMAVVRDCLIEALLKGFYPFNNEFNIISGNFYGAQNGWYRKVCEIPGLTDLDVVPGTPMLHKESGHTVVRVAAKWKLHGEREELKGQDGKPGRVFTIRVNQGMGPDAIIGKALAKCYKAIYRKLTGTEQTHDDEDDAITTGLEKSRAEELTAKMQQPAGSTNGAAGAHQGNGQEPTPATTPARSRTDSGTVTRGQLKRLQDLSRQAGLNPEQFDGFLARYGAERAEELSEAKADELVAALMAEAEAANVPGARQPGEDG